MNVLNTKLIFMDQTLTRDHVIKLFSTVQVSNYSFQNFGENKIVTIRLCEAVTFAI